MVRSLHYRGEISESREYSVWRSPDGCQWTLLNPRFDLRNHSPTGFCWGYGGSGPAQLALALCCDVLANDRLAEMVYQKFKWAWVSRLPLNEPWLASRHELFDVILAIGERWI